MTPGFENGCRVIVLAASCLLFSACGNDDSAASPPPAGEPENGNPSLDQPGEPDDFAGSDVAPFEGRWTGVLSQIFDSDDGPYSASLSYELELQAAGDSYTGTSRITSLDGSEPVAAFGVSASFTENVLVIIEQTLEEGGGDAPTPQAIGSSRSAQCLSRLEFTVSGTRLVGTREAPRCPFGSVYLSRVGSPAAPEREWYETLPACPCQFRDVASGAAADDVLGNPGTWFELINRPSEIEGMPVANPPLLPQLGDNHPGAVSELRWAPDDGGPGQQCTYGFTGELITGGLAAGTPDQVSPGRGSSDLLAVLGHIRADVRPFSDLSCEVYLERYPPNNALSCATRVVTPVPDDTADMSCKATVNTLLDPDGEPPGESVIPPVQPLVPVPVSYTDPHLVTIDGLGYDFQAVGEFVLLESELDGLEIQARQVRLGGPGSHVSVNSGFAFDVAGDRVAIVRSPSGDATLFVGDTEQAVTGDIALASGGTVTVEAGARYRVLWPDGSVARVLDRGRFMNLSLALDERHSSRVRGLLGDFDGETENDIVTRDGEDLTPRPAASDLYGIYADSWRVDDESSLFFYFDGQDTAFFTDRLFPGRVVTAADLDDRTRASARATCEAAGIVDEVLLESCILDVGISDDPAFADGVRAVEMQTGGVPTTVADVQGDVGVPSRRCTAAATVDAAGLPIPDLAGRYEGTMTNPDSGNTWTNELILEQCGAAVHGVSRNRVGDALSNRRLEGRWQEGRLTLAAGFPYDSRLSNAARVWCEDVVFVLEPRGDGLVGPWSSSNCRRGGVLDVVRAADDGAGTDLATFPGIWTGAVDQPGSRPYSLRMILTATEDGSLAGSTDYPELGCGGSLEDGRREGNEFVFRESLTSGQSRCLDQGTVRVILQPDGSMDWRYASPGAGNITAVATLLRE